MELILGLIRLILGAFLGRLTDKFEAGKITPLHVSSCLFLLGLCVLVVSIKSTVEATKLVLGVWGCHALFVATVYIMIGNHKQYYEDTAIWISGMTSLVLLTGCLVLIMDYSNTKTLANSFIFGFVAATLYRFSKDKNKEEKSREQ